MTTRSLSYTSDTGAPPGLPDEAEILGRASGENFPVASALLPGAARRHLMAFYGFARLVDQIGDAYEGDRLAALDWLQAETEACLEGQRDRHHLIAGAVASTVELDMAPDPLFALIEANRRDQTVRSYATFEELRDYCRLSADPVGHLVLGAFRAADPARRQLSDAICTGLQLVEHWQDVREDALNGRVYLPDEDLRRFGVDPVELRGPGPASAQLRALMAFEVARARRWLDRGRPLAATLPLRPRLAVAGFWAGGRASLDAIAGRDFDVLLAPARRRRSRTLRYMVSALARRTSSSPGSGG